MHVPTGDSVAPIEFMRGDFGTGDARRSPNARRAAHWRQQRDSKFVCSSEQEIVVEQFAKNRCRRLLLSLHR